MNDPIDPHLVLTFLQLDHTRFFRPIVAFLSSVGDLWSQWYFFFKFRLFSEEKIEDVFLFTIFLQDNPEKERTTMGHWHLPYIHPTFFFFFSYIRIIGTGHPRQGPSGFINGHMMSVHTPSTHDVVQVEYKQGRHEVSRTF